MRYLVQISFLMIFIFSGCQDSTTTSHKRLTLMGLNGEVVEPTLNVEQEKKQTQNVVNKTKELDPQKILEEQHKNKLEQSKIESSTKIEIEKIKANSQLTIAKINAEANKKIAESDYKTKVKTLELDSQAQKENMIYIVYIVIAIALVAIVGLVLLYLNSKKNRELKKQLHDEKLRHEQFLKEQELEEQRVHKLLELVADGKVSKSVEKEVVLTLTQPKTKLLN